MRQNKKNKGFTLVELLIVVAIIGILAAVLTPQFLNARKVASQRAAEAYAHNVYTAVQAHIAHTSDFTLDDYDCAAGWTNDDDTLFPVPNPKLSFDTSYEDTGCKISTDASDTKVTVALKITNGTDTNAIVIGE